MQTKAMQGPRHEKSYESVVMHTPIRPPASVDVDSSWSYLGGVEGTVNETVHGNHEKTSDLALQLLNHE